MESNFLGLPGGSFQASNVNSNVSMPMIISTAPSFTSMQRRSSTYPSETKMELVTHVPDSIINFNHQKSVPASKEFLGVVMFADISGFTALTEKYSSMGTDGGGGARGTDKLCATLNTYIGMIVDEIVDRKGDVLKFAGDAIFATWRFSHIGNNAKTMLNKVIKCSFDIQRKCDNYMTEVGIVLRVKLAIAVGSMCLTVVGLPHAKQFDMSGPAVTDVGITEKEASPGTIILSQLAWANCDQSLFSFEPLQNGRFYQVTGQSHSDNRPTNSQAKLQHDVTAILDKTAQERVVISDIDHLIDLIPDYRQNMPKALLPDEDEKITTGMFLMDNVLPEDKRKKQKKQKFDRKSMTCYLGDQDVDHIRAYVARQVLDKLDDGQNCDWLSEMRQVSTLFINMKLPDKFEEASDALQKAFEVVCETATEYRGTLNKVFSFDKGCTFIVIFGLPGQKHEDDALRALKCAHTIYETLHAHQEITSESIGVTTGVAFCGVVGHKNRHEYTVIGSKVNMAARLMMFYAEKLTCDAETYDAVRMHLNEEDFVKMPYIELKGLKDPGVVREYDPNMRQKEEEEHFDYPILGRDEEMETFRDFMSSYTQTRSKSVITVTGDQGIGKTRLLEEFMDEASKEKWKIVHIAADADKKDADVAVTMVKSLLGNTEEDRKNTILPIVKDNKEIMDNLGLIEDIIGRQNYPTPITSDLAELEKRRNKTLIQIVCSMVDQPQCCLFVVDNAKNIDKASWEFLSHLLKSGNPFICFAIRSVNELSPSIIQLLGSSMCRLDLKGLRSDHVVDFVCQMLHVNKIPKKIVEIMETSNQGNPLQCEQLTKNMAYSKTIQVVPTSNLIPMELTPSNQSLINVAPIGSSSSSSSGEGVGVTVVVDEGDGDTESLDNNLRMSASQYVTEVTDQVINKVARRGKSLMSCYTADSMMSHKFIYDDDDHIEASPGAVGEFHKVCIISPDADVNDMLVPKSVEDIVLARIDRMDLREQTIIKCAAVLGSSFTRDLLKAIIPKNVLNKLDTTLQTLLKQNIFECGSLDSKHNNSDEVNEAGGSGGGGGGAGGGRAYHHNITGINNSQVLCGCYAHEGYAAINLLQTNPFDDGKKRTCLFFHFCDKSVQETAYALWLDDQRKALFEKAAMYLEKNSDKCRGCGGNGFIPGYGKGTASGSEGKYAPKKYSLSANQKLRYASVRTESEHPHFRYPSMYPPKHGSQSGKQARLQDVKTFFMNRDNPKQPKNLSDVVMGHMHVERNRSNALADVNDDTGVYLGQCYCTELQAENIPKLVNYWNSAGNLLKTFQYSLDAASIALETDDSGKALKTLKSIDELVAKEETQGFKNFSISDEERARIDSLKGQALCNMDCVEDGIKHFTTALTYLKSPPPSSQMSLMFRTWKASLVQLLHQKMPGVFLKTYPNHQLLLERIDILSHLARAYISNREYDRAFLADLEQLNVAEEIANEYWNVVMGAYTDMISSCHHYGKTGMGAVLEGIALQTSHLGETNLNDDLATVANLQLAITSFYLHTGNLSGALDIATSAYTSATKWKDFRLRTSSIPVLVQISLMKLRFQSSGGMLTELEEITGNLTGRMEEWRYRCCCADMLLYTGDATYLPSDITGLLKHSTPGGYSGFAMDYVCNGLALWYARQDNWATAITYYNELPADDPHHSVDPLLYCNAIAISTEYQLLQFRHQGVNKKKVQHYLNLFHKAPHGKTLLQARCFHFQAYFLYLRRQTHKAKLRLDASLAASRNGEMSFDYEWAMASKLHWFRGVGDDVEMQPSGQGLIKYVLPSVK